MADFKDVREKVEGLLGQIDGCLAKKSIPDATARLEEAKKLFEELKALVEKDNEVEVHVIRRLTDDIDYYSEKISRGLPKADTGKRKEFQEETELHRLGYHISGMTRDHRWDILVNDAIPAIGLAEVVRTILKLMSARMINEDLAQRNQVALTEWNFDLDRLLQEYSDSPELKSEDLHRYVQSIKRSLHYYGL